MSRRKFRVAFLELLIALGQVSGLVQGVLEHLHLCTILRPWIDYLICLRNPINFIFCSSD